MVGAALFICALWVIDADASRRRPAIAVPGGAVVVDQEIEGMMRIRRAGHVPYSATSRLPLLTAGIVATVGMSMLPQLAVQSPPRAASGPTFEVASIKLNPTGSAGPTGTQVLPGGRYIVTNMPIRLLIGQIYRVPSLRLVGGPSWIASEHFDINAQANGELFPNGGERPLDSALRALLADRFKLVVHTETRQLPIYALRVVHSDGRLGPNPTRSSTTDCDAVLAAGRGRGGAPPLRPGARTGAAVRRSELPGHALGG